ncbi:MAG: fibronectin type III domain-containing protein [Acidaminococcaceae bacterium]
MKRILKILIPLVLILCAGAYAFLPGAQSLSQQPFAFSKNVAGAYSSMSKNEAMYVRQIIAADNAKSRTIMWQSEAAENGAFVEYRVKGKEQISSAPATNEPFTDDKITTYLHTVTLSSLTPDTKYEYRVGYGDKRSEWHDFATAGRGKFKAIIFPDSQSNDYRGWANLVQAAGRANPDASFFVNMGDLVDNGEDHTQWRAWFDSVQGMIDRIPTAPILGNHETYDLNWKVRMPTAYLNLFSLPANGSQERKNQYYSYDYGDVHFIVLNTQMAEMEQFQPGLLAAETEWFKNDITKTDKKWKIVLMHKDVLTYAFKNRTDRQAGISDIGQVFMPLFDQYGVDVVLTAHLHTYRNRGHIQNFERNASGPLYILTGVAGNVRYPELWADHSLDVTVAPQPETDNYMTLEATDNTLKFAAFLPDGKQIDRVEIKK